MCESLRCGNSELYLLKMKKGYHVRVCDNECITMELFVIWRKNECLNERNDCMREKEKEKDEFDNVFFLFISCLYLAGFNPNPPQYKNSILTEMFVCAFL